MKPGKGFTLLELLLAVTLASMVIFLSYQFFNAVSRTNEFLRRYGELERITPSLFKLMLKDFESSNLSYGKPLIGKDSVTFYTENCYYFKGICKVKYWVFKGKGRNLLVRSEYKLNEITGKGMDIPLTSKIAKIEKVKITGKNLLKIKLVTSGNQTLPFVFHLH